MIEAHPRLLTSLIVMSDQDSTCLADVSSVDASRAKAGLTRLTFGDKRVSNLGRRVTLSSLRLKGVHRMWCGVLSRLERWIARCTEGRIDCSVKDVGVVRG